jgi:hypothetical protein
MNIQPLAVTTDLMTAFYEGAFCSDDNGRLGGMGRHCCRRRGRTGLGLRAVFRTGYQALDLYH